MKKRYIESRSKYIKVSNKEISELININEALTNDITWGDSLVGRLLASIFRMAKLGVNMVTIKRYLSQLDNALGEGVVKKMIENDSTIESDLEEFQNSSVKNGMLDALKEDPGNSAKVISEYRDEYGTETIDKILLTLPENIQGVLKEVVIKSVDKIQEKSSVEIYKIVYKILKSLKGVLDTKDTLNNQLFKIKTTFEENNITDSNTVNEIGKTLNRLKRQYRREEDIKAIDQLETNNIIDIVKDATKTVKSAQKILGINAEKFNDTSEAMEIYQALKNYYHNLLNKEAKSIVKKFLEKCISNSNVSLVLENKNITSKNVKREILSKNDEVMNNSEKEGEFDNNTKKKEGLQRYKHSMDKTISGSSAKKIGDFNLSENKYKNLHTGNSLNQTIGSQDKHLQVAYERLLDDIKKMESGKDKYKVDSDFIGALIVDFEKKKDDRKYFYELFYMIYEYMTDKRTGVSEPTPLYESVDEFNSDNNKGPMSRIAESISRFLKRSRQFKGEGFYGGMGDLGKYLQTLNSEMDNLIKEYGQNGIILKGDSSKNKSTDKGTLDVELGEDGTTVVNGEEIDWDSYRDSEDEIKAKGDEIVKKTESEITRLEEESFDVNFVKVLRIFKKAHNIMVVNNIPSVRSDGKVTVARSNNWEPLGGRAVGISGTANGPFRNKKLFNTWNDGVLKLIDKYRDSLKYSRLVADSSVSYSNIKNKSDNGTNRVELNAKASVLEFMADALDDSKLFASLSGSGNPGYQRSYLKQYMGYDDKSKSAAKQGEAINDDINEKHRFVPAENFKISDQPYKISATARGVDGKQQFNVYLVPITRRGDKYLYKVSKSDNFLEAYIEDYKSDGPGADAGGDKVSFIVLDKNSNIKYNEVSKSIKIVGVQDWEAKNPLEITLYDIKDIKRMKMNAKFNGNKKSYDVYPQNSIDEIIKKLS